MDQTLTEIMAEARRMDAEAAGQPAQQPASQAPPAPGPSSPTAGQGESLEALEARLRAAHEDRQRNASDAARNEELANQALRARGFSALPKLESMPTEPTRTRLDGSPWTPADRKLAEELQRYLPGIDLMGARTPPGYRR